MPHPANTSFRPWLLNFLRLAPFPLGRMQSMKIIAPFHPTRRLIVKLSRQGPSWTIHEDQWKIQKAGSAALFESR